MLNSWFRRLTRSRQIPMPVRIPARKSGIASRHMAVLPETLADGGELLVPLALRPDLAVQPAVAPGDRIEPRQPLNKSAADPGVGAFSPAAAIVMELTTVDTEYACELPAVRLRLSAQSEAAQTVAAVRHQVADAAPRTAGDATAIAPTVATPDLRGVLADMARIEDLPATLDELGVLAMHAGRLQPMGTLLQQAAGRTTRLVINAIQSEPRLGSHLRLTLDAADEILAGAKALCTYLGLRRCTLLISTTHGMRQGLFRRLRRFGIRVVPVRTSFPGGDDSIVARRLFHRPVPYGGDPLAAGTLVLPADAVWRAGLALVRQQPVLLQPVTVAGDCLAPTSQRVYLLPIGLTVHALISCLARRNVLPHEPKVVLLGGPMTGTAIVDTGRTVITQATQAVLLMRGKPPRQTTACIRCGWCIQACSVGIDPIAILETLEAGHLRLLSRLATERCISCGVCSSICPSHLPLAQAARTSRALRVRDDDTPPV